MFEELSIYIPSKGRPDKQKSLSYFKDDVGKLVKVVIEPSQELDYSCYIDDGNLLVLPDHIKGIDNIRQWIVENCKTKYLIMFDDDFDFCKRKDNSTKLEKMESADEIVELLLDWMEFEDIKLVGLSARQGNNHVEEDYKEITRQSGVHGIDVEYFKEKGFRFDKQDPMEDFRVVLDYLSSGIPNRVSYKYCWNQSATGAEGGCSEDRNYETQEKACSDLKSAHPEFVKIIDKKLKTSVGDMKERKDVRIQWKKSFKSKLNR